MIVLYWKNAVDVQNCTFNIAIPDVLELEEQANKLYIQRIPNPLVVINDSTKVGWFAVPEQTIATPEYEEEGGISVEAPRMVAELNLTYFTTDSLPKSQHYAQVVSVDLTKPLPVEVRRWFEPANQWFDGIRCLASGQAKGLWQTGEIKAYDPNYAWDAPENKDTLVVVDYIPDPRDPSEQIPIVSDKVVKTW